jgi:selenocysteine lyase/cysteine desulfurase
MIDVERVRGDTPGVAHGVHLNAAGASLPPRPVTNAVIEHLRREQLHGGYEAARNAADQLNGTYLSLARLIGCSPQEIALVENATRAWDMAFYGMDFRPGDRILTSQAEYASNAIPIMQVAHRTGALIEVVDNDDHGQLCITDLERRVNAGNVALVAVTHVPTQGGLINPAAQIGAVTRSAGIPFLLDACQSVGQLPVDVDHLGVDMLSATGRKFLRGPRGTGFLYVRDSMVDRLTPPFLDLLSATWVAPDRYEIRPDARRFETWEKNVAGVIGLGVAVDYLLELGIDCVQRRITLLSQSLRRQLSESPGIQVLDQGEFQCGIVTFLAAGVSATDLTETLARHGFYLHVSRATSAQYDLSRRGLTEIVRASVHYYNTEDEIRSLVEAVNAVR